MNRWHVAWNDARAVLACRMHRVVVITGGGYNLHCERCLAHHNAYGPITTSVSPMILLPDQDALLAAFQMGGWEACEAAALEVLDRMGSP